MTTAETILHAPPGAGMTYLPATGNSDIDAPHGIAAADSLHTLDERIGGINTATLNVEPSKVASYCDHTCGGGCTDSIVKPAALPADPLTVVFSDLDEHLDAIRATISTMSGTWGERMQAKYSAGGDTDLAALTERTDAVKATIKPVIDSSNSHTNGAYRTLRETVKSSRRYLASAVEQHKSDHSLGHLVTSGIGSLGTPAWFIISPVTGFLSWLQGHTAGEHGSVDAPSIPELNAAGDEHDKTIDALDAALAEWKIGKGDTEKGTPNPVNHANTVSDVTPMPDDTPLPGDGIAAATTDPTDDLRKKLDDLMNAPMDQGMPQMPGGGMPGGGMPQMPSMPQVPFGQDMGQPFGQEMPLSDELPEDDEGDLADDTDDDTDDDEPLTAEADEVAEEDEDVAPDDGGIAPIDAAVPEAATPFDPESVEARTVDVGNGRQVEFPTSHNADVARSLIAAGSDNPKSVYAAAAEAGYDLPPMGQDIGEMVPPSAMQAGDVISGADGKSGMYLGQGDVLMEGGAVQRLSDVANFDGEHQGIFRLTEPTTGHARLDGVAQTVDTGTPEPTLKGSLFSGSEPGVPTDDAIPFSTTSEDASSMPGRSTGGGGLDAGSAFAN
ncbi:hypothetical protein [Mycolicibacter arupensis]|uniref:Uncharacterized protein n=1 Tax=Mycolicibacter arupensis TaxID=342002 RepID=A0A5C7Y372_9MYCO|nr:hypothetical protein [Mycolicibacter arupensis]TXI55938.1 MAG: hypothetical protein E6Q54_11975 [Mycolicibacter arupensis]